MARGTRKKKLVDLEGQQDATATIDAAVLLTEAQALQKKLVADLLERAKGSPNVTTALKARHASEVEQKRTADNFEEWQHRFVSQVAAAWILSCVFVRVLEDRGLLKQNRLAGPGALDSQRLFRDMAPSLGDRDYLRTVFKELSRLPAGAELFDARHNPVWLLAPSAEGVRELMGMFRTPNAETPALRFGQADTRFLGDLYQDLDEGVRKRYALLQTPKFVESFILDRTLERAVEKFGVAETELIDPTCGSGHFLLGAFERLYDHRLRLEPGLSQNQAAMLAIQSVAGSDINPYAVAIARFRLTLAFLEKTECRKLADAPRLPLRLAVADSLLHNSRLSQRQLWDQKTTDKTQWAKEYALEDEDAAEKVLHHTYAAVVGNPPYITVKDAVLRERYRQDYDSAAGKYSLSSPFMERFFQLARKGGFVGKITANSFMKREFGKAVIEKYLPKVNLELVVNTSGAYIPGHGTPTVLLFGTPDEPQGSDVLTVLAKRGEPTTPAEPENGLVWRSIAVHWAEQGFENDYISVAKVERSTFGKHPWSLGGGGASELKALLEVGRDNKLGDISASIGISSVTGEDGVYLLPPSAAKRIGIKRTKPMVIGELIRDWSLSSDDACLFTYNDNLELLPPEDAESELQYLWSYRSIINKRKRFGVPMLERGLTWYELQELYADKLRTPLSIAFAEVATHNHFVLDRGGKVFKQTAPIIKLKEGATEEDHLALLAYLNSSTACFWMKQVCHDKGGGGIGGGFASALWEKFYVRNGSSIAELPLPPQDAFKTDRYRQTPNSPKVDSLEFLGRHISELAEARARSMPGAVLRKRLASLISDDNQPEQSTNDGLRLKTRMDLAREESEHHLARMCSLQEELDWMVYEGFGLLTKEEAELHHRAREEALPGFPPRIDRTPAAVTRSGLYPGHRPFEVALARDSLKTNTPTAWFDRNGYETPGTASSTYAPSYQRLIETRLAIIDKNPQIRLIEQPEFKHRWTKRDFDAELIQEGQALLSEAAERRFKETADPRRSTDISHDVLADAKCTELAELIGPSDTEPSRWLADLWVSNAVPFLSSYIYKPTGQEKRSAWEQTWDLQRKEDAGEEVGDIPVPPKYKPSDFQKGEYWRLRGKLDVPKERFISYPGLESDEDGEPLFGWAGWNHLTRAKALATLYVDRRDNESWTVDRLTPMLAGLLELIPWVVQWHNEPDEEFGGLRLGDYYRQFLDEECRNFGLSHDDLRAWRPPEKKRGGRGKKKVTREE